MAFLAKCSDQPRICELSEAKSRGEWSRKELSDCRHLRDALSLINGSNIPPYTDDPWRRLIRASLHRNGTCLCFVFRPCVRTYVGQRATFLLLQQIRNRLASKQELPIVELAQIFRLPGNCRGSGNFTSFQASARLLVSLQRVSRWQLAYGALYSNCLCRRFSSVLRTVTFSFYNWYLNTARRSGDCFCRQSVLCIWIWSLLHIHGDCY